VAVAGASSANGTGRPLRKLGFALLLAVAAVAATQARAPLGDEAVVALASLPPEARQTEQLIRRGGPFAYAKDGSVFGNRERQLPRHDRGYYREYTVKTPGARDRGARRIVCGGRTATAPEACYYTADHYASFKRIAQ
jgi:ribonuclease T1